MKIEIVISLEELLNKFLEIDDEVSPSAIKQN